MVFRDKKYKTLGDVLKIFQLKHQFLNTFEVEITFNLPSYLVNDIKFTLKHIVRISREVKAICAFAKVFEKRVE